MNITTLTDDDARLLREMVKWWKRHGNQVGRYPPQGEDYMTPEVYIAYTPAAGIPALSDVGTGTGTGTGTSILVTDDDMVEPGSATCRIFHKVDGLLQAAGFSLIVNNVMPVAVAGHLFVEIVRDKWGDWYVPPLPLRVGTCP